MHCGISEDALDKSPCEKTNHVDLYMYTYISCRGWSGTATLWIRVCKIGAEEHKSGSLRPFAIDIRVRAWVDEDTIGRCRALVGPTRRDFVLAFRSSTFVGRSWGLFWASPELFPSAGCVAIWRSGHVDGGKEWVGWGKGSLGESWSCLLRPIPRARCSLLFMTLRMRFFPS